MNQLIFRLEKAPSATSALEDQTPVATLKPATLPTPTPLKFQYAPGTRSTVNPASYVVQIGSYQTKANADQHVEELRDKKSQAYAVPLDLADRGRWHRALIQRFATKKEDGHFAEKIMADGLVDLAFPVLLPFAVEVGTKKAHANASPVESRLRNKRFYPYVLQVANAGVNDQKYRILAGAYETPVAAAELSKTLLAARIPNQIVMP